MMRTISDRAEGHRLRALIVLLWRWSADQRSAIAPRERPGSRARRGARPAWQRRQAGEVGMDRWAWDQLDPWLEIRRELPIGAVLCVIHGATAGRRWEASAARKQLHHAAAAAGVRRRFAPHQLRHANAVEMAHEGSRVVIQRQLGHANHGITSIYLQGIDSSEIIRPWTAVANDLGQRRPPDEAIAPNYDRVGSGVFGPTRGHPGLATLDRVGDPEGDRDGQAGPTRARAGAAL